MPKLSRALVPGLAAIWGCAACACGGDDARLDTDQNRLAPGQPTSDGEPPAGSASDAGSSSGGAPASAPMQNEPASGPLPDLVLDAAYLVDTTVLDTVTVNDECLLAQRCVSGLGERRVVRFGSRMGNLGEADFMLGAPGSDNPLWTRNTCRQTFDVAGFARYVLVDSVTGEQAAVGAKNGSCVADSERWLEESGTSCDVYDCTRQGISRGCADNYGAALECQWVDITDVPSGTYDLVVTINAERSFAELDYANDVVRVRLTLDASGISVEP